MFGLFRRAVFILTLILSMSSCSVFNSVDSGFDPAETVQLDDDYEMSVAVDKGDVVALDMLIPTAKGYRIAGASFDPEMLVLEHYLEYEDDGMMRAQYFFSTLVEGSSTVLIKMEPLSGGESEIYRQVTVSAETDDGLF